MTRTLACLLAVATAWVPQSPMRNAQSARPSPESAIRHPPSALVIVAPARPSGDAQPAGRQLLDRYCVTCHNQRTRTAGLTLDTMDVDHVDRDPATWEKVARKIRTGMMPPSGARRPERVVLDGFASELETRLDQAARAKASTILPTHWACRPRSFKATSPRR